MASCNGCSIDKLKKKHGDNLVRIPNQDGGVDYYAKEGKSTRQYKGIKTIIDGEALYWIMWVMAEGHSLDKDCELIWNRRS